MQKAIEVEYWVIDDSGALTSPGELTDVSEYVEEEFVEPLFELKTPPCETFDDLRTTFLAQLAEVLDRADELGKHLVPLGTPVHAESINRIPCGRGDIQRRVLGTEFDYAKYCAGTHLHFEQRNVVDQLNVLIALDPALALLNSSPYFQGRPVADGARAYLYRQKCYEQFPKHGQLWDYVDTVAEWETRREHRFKEFKAAALDAGVDEAAVDASFSPDDVVWTPVRLREAMPTVEWRSPDAALPSQILRLAEAMDSMMERVHQSVVRIDGEAGRVEGTEITLPEFDAVCDYANAAIHDGLQSADVSAYLERMGFDVGAYEPTTRTIGGRDYVSPRAARDLRRRYATLLRWEVDSLTAEPARRRQTRSGPRSAGRAPPARAGREH